jgi:hypothetical protein
MAPPRRPPDPPDRSTKSGGIVPGSKVLAGSSGTGTSKSSHKVDDSSTLGNLAVTPAASGQAGASLLPPPIVSGQAETSLSSQISTMSSGSSAASGSSNVGTESSSQRPSLFGSFAYGKFHKKPAPAPKSAALAGKTPEVTLVDAPLPTSRPWSEDPGLPKITPDLKEIQRLEKEQSDQVMQQQRQQKTQRKRPAADPVHGRARRNATGNMAYRGTSDGVKKPKTNYTAEELAWQKLEKDAAARQKEEQNLEKKKNARLAAMNWRNGTPRGADVPGGEFAQKNQFGWTMLLTQADDRCQVPGAEKWQHSVDYKVKFICDSQDPQILLQKSKGVKKVHAISSMTLGTFPDESAPRKLRKLYTYTMSKDNLTVDTIRAFLTQSGINEIPADKVQAVLDYHSNLKPADFKPEDLGLEMMLFKVSQFGFFSTDDFLGKTMSEQNPWVIVIRLRPRCDPIVDKLFRGCRSQSIRRARTKGRGTGHTPSSISSRVGLPTATVSVTLCSSNTKDS